MLLDSASRMSMHETRLSDPGRRTGPWGERFEMLDGWRGLAALAVVVHHVTPLKIGHEAVMVFFVISGYCIAASADACLRKGLGFRNFMWRRVRRIFPPYFFAVVFFLLTRLVRWKLVGTEFDRTIPEYLQNFTLTQWFTLLHNPQPVPSDNPTLFVAAFWSLNFEEQFYLVMGVLMLVTSAVARRRILVVLLAAAIAWNLLNTHLSYGLFIEYWVHFAVGTAVFYRLCRIQQAGYRRLIDGLLIGAAILAGWSHFSGRDASPRMLSLEYFCVAVFALLLICLRPINAAYVRSRAAYFLGALGLISYSLYLIHQFNIVIGASIVNKVVPAGAPPMVSMVGQIGFHIVLATGFWYCFERPFLNRAIVRSDSPSEVPMPVSGKAGA